MIVEVLMAVGGTFLQLLGFVLPTWSIPNEWISAYSTFISKVNSLNWIFPFDDLLILISVLLGIEIVYWIIKFSVSLINWLRGSGEIKI